VCCWLSALVLGHLHCSLESESIEWIEWISTVSLVAVHAQRTWKMNLNPKNDEKP
jgi:hypothetical protein